MTCIQHDYIPNGSMCQACAKWKDDCRALDFESMPAMEKTARFTVVKCSSFQPVALSCPLCKEKHSLSQCPKWKVK